MLIFMLLFSLNISYSMQVPLKRDSVEYKAVYSKSNSKVSIPKKIKNNNLKRLKRFCIIVVVIVVSLLFLLSIGLRKP
jgi:hypothetical protein